MKDTTKSNTFLKKLEHTHQYKTFLYLAIGGIFILFLTLVFVFISKAASAPEHLYALPKSFALSTLLLLLSSYLLLKVVQDGKDEYWGIVLKRLRQSLVIGVLFMIFQIMGWAELIRKGVYLSSKVSATLLYMISGLHLLHFLAGFIFLIVLTVQLSKAMKQEVKRLIWITNPHQILKLELFVIYWHFMDLLWVSLFFVFFFMM